MVTHAVLFYLQIVRVLDRNLCFLFGLSGVAAVGIQGTGRLRRNRTDRLFPFSVAHVHRLGFSMPNRIRFYPIENSAVIFSITTR